VGAPVLAIQAPALVLRAQRKPCTPPLGLTGPEVAAFCRIMSVEQMQQAVGKLPEKERRKFAIWLLAKYPPRSTGDLVSQAEAEARQAKWVPQPPGRDNIPTGKALAKAVGRAKVLGLAR